MYFVTKRPKLTFFHLKDGGFTFNCLNWKLLANYFRTCYKSGLSHPSPDK